jgi:hypothetical protein
MARSREITPAVHDRVAANHVHGAGYGEQGDVLGQDLSRILGAHQASFEHRKARRHPHDQSATDEKIKRIECVL